MVAQNGKTALIVASSDELVAAVSRRLAADGFSVVLASPGPHGHAQASVTAIRTAGGRATAVEADLNHPEAMRDLFDEAEAMFAGVDVLVSDADIMQLSPLADADETSFRRHIAINTKGALRGAREAAKRLRCEGRMISVSAGPSSYLTSIHAATTAGLKALGRVLAAETQARQLTLNAVALCRKPLGLSDASLKPRNPPKDLCEAVAFLAQADRVAVNGKVLCAERVTVSSLREQER